MASVADQLRRQEIGSDDGHHRSRQMIRVGGTGSAFWHLVRQACALAVPGHGEYLIDVFPRGNRRPIAVRLLKDKLGSCHQPISGRIGEVRDNASTPSPATSQVRCTSQLRDKMRPRACRRLGPGDRIPANRELADHAWRSPHHRGEMPMPNGLEGRSDQATWARHVYKETARLEDHSACASSLNGNGGIRWELLFADERGRRNP